MGEFTFAHNASICFQRRLRIAFGEVSMIFPSATIVLALIVDGSVGWLLKTMLDGALLVLLCTCVLYAYVNGCTNRSQFLQRSPIYFRSLLWLFGYTARPGRLSEDGRHWLQGVLSRGISWGN